jgi:type II secretory pathway predicted ATPase ExeA
MIASNPDATVAPLDRSSAEGSRYLGGAHGRAVGTLTQAILDQDVLVLLTGSAGAGKTVVLNATLAVLTATAISVIRLSNPSQRAWSQRDLVRQILDGPTEGPVSAATDAVVDSSAHRNVASAIAERIAATAGEAQVVIAVDDAHSLTDDAIELLLLLASPARGSKRPPQLILSGRGEFWERDPISELLVIARLAERVIIDPLTGRDAMEYVAFRLKPVGGSNHVISSDALTEILNYSGGLPAQIDEVLGPANSIRVCRGSHVLTGDMVEAAIATMASVPETPPSGLASITTGTDTSSEDWVSSLRLIYRTQVSPASADEGSTAVLDRGQPVSDSELPSVVPPVFHSPSSRVPPSGGNAVVPFQVESPGGLATALMIRYIAPGRRRLGRTAAAAATFVMIIGSLACVITLRSASLANAIIWPWSSGATGGGDAHGDRPSIAPSEAQLGAARANLPEATALASPTEAVPPLGASVATGHGLVTLDSVSPPLTSPTSVGPPVTASVAASGSGGLPGDQTVQSGPVQTSRQIAGSPIAAPPIVAAVSPQMATFLVERGNSMLQQGDVLSARLFFEQAAEAGNRQGAIGAAKISDPAFLATTNAPGLKSDVARAIKWYRLAFTTFGDQYASERLKALAKQRDQ